MRTTDKKMGKSANPCPEIYCLQLRVPSKCRARCVILLRRYVGLQPIEISVQLPRVGAARPALIKRFTEGTAAVQHVAMIGAGVLHLTVRDHVPAAAVRL